jgi:hypothetical protein
VFEKLEDVSQELKLDEEVRSLVDEIDRCQHSVKQRDQEEEPFVVVGLVEHLVYLFDEDQ